MATELNQTAFQQTVFDTEESSLLLQQSAELQAQLLVIPKDLILQRPLAPGLAIDPKNCVDHDDAIYVVEADGGFQVAITISAVGEFIEAGSPIDRLATRRGFTRYSSNKAVEPMLPRRISEELFSLRQGNICPTMTIFMQLNGDLDLQSVDVVRTSYFSPKDASYDDAYEMLLSRESEHHKMLMDAAKLSQRLERKIAHKPYSDWEPIITLQTPHQIVGELMRLANTAVAVWSEEKQLPILFRCHPGGDDAGYSSRRGGAYYTPINRGHQAMRAPVYAQITSPLRRAPDLLDSRHILSHVAMRGAVMDVDMLGDFAKRVNLAEREIKKRK